MKWKVLLSILRLLPALRGAANSRMPYTGMHSNQGQRDEEMCRWCPGANEAELNSHTDFLQSRDAVTDVPIINVLLDNGLETLSHPTPSHSFFSARTLVIVYSHCRYRPFGPKSVKLSRREFLDPLVFWFPQTEPP